MENFQGVIWLNMILSSQYVLLFPIKKNIYVLLFPINK